MRVCSVGFEDHEVGDIHHTYAQLGKTLTEERRSSNHLERHLYTNAYEDYVWVDAIVDTRKLPDGSTSDAMLSASTQLRTKQ